jgi:acid phosphatase
VPPVDDVPHEPLFLTSHGAQEAFSLGAQLRQEYAFTPGGGNLTVWYVHPWSSCGSDAASEQTRTMAYLALYRAAGQQRVVDTATYFLRGYLSQGNYAGLDDENQGTVIILPDSVNYTFANSLTTSAACPAYNSGVNSTVVANFRASYQGAIASRLSGFLDGLVLDDTDIGVMGDLCGFQAALNGDVRFCSIFRGMALASTFLSVTHLFIEDEMLDYEYAWDLNYYYGCAHC